MNEKEFAELIKRCLSGQATKEEIALVEEWLDERRKKNPFNKLSVGEKEKIRVKIFKDISAKMREPGWFSSKEKLITRPILFYRAAAAIILLSVLFYTVSEFRIPSGKERISMVQSVSSTDSGKKVILSDSTIVWLKGNSSILYPEKFSGSERNITLTGEALFEVSKDKDHPFVIQCGGLMAKVLGTSFNIRSSETDIEVFVLTGKVALSFKGNSNGLIVHPNEKAVYNSAENQIAKVMAKENEITAKTIGTQYSMRFHATAMQEIIRRIEGKFDARVSLSDERLGNCTITADFTDQSLDRTLSMIAQTLEIQYEISNNRVTLKGAGCD